MVKVATATSVRFPSNIETPYVWQSFLYGRNQLWNDSRARAHGIHDYADVGGDHCQRVCVCETVARLQRACWQIVGRLQYICDQRHPIDWPMCIVHPSIQFTVWCVTLFHANSGDDNFEMGQVHTCKPAYLLVSHSTPLGWLHSTPLHSHAAPTHF